MPLYEYYCPDCHTKFDALRPMSKADETIACKSCDSERPTRTLSMFATISSNADSTNRQPVARSFGGGCCGGACGCGH
ncbi:MAG: zinc ribbon domain-containing protein [Anaerolineae bacterium]|nr:zinc ribbon domain-containing protein [Anaerolineae bacterium]